MRWLAMRGFWGRVGLVGLLAGSACGDDVADAAGSDATGTEDGPAGDDALPPGGSTGSGDSGDDADGGEQPPRAGDDWAAERAQLRRLTGSQYAASLRGLLDLEAPVDGVPDDLVQSLFANVGASAITSSPLAIEQYEDIALAVTEAVFADSGWRAEVVGCDPELPSCVDAFVGTFGHRAWRRPLTVGERLRYTALFERLRASLDDPWVAARFVAVGLLTSPNFMHLVELGEPDPAKPGRLRYTSTEMASRLSYFLWNGPPDAELLERAEAGDLTRGDVVAEQVARMLDDARATIAVQAFFTQLLGLAALEVLHKDPAVFPEATPELLAGMSGEVTRLVEHVVVHERGGIAELLTSRDTFVTESLADLYDAVHAGRVDGEGFAALRFADDSPRFGYLGTAAFLAANARVRRTSPTLRGLAVQQRLLCTELPPPPPDVDAELPEPGQTGEPQTMREILSQHATDPACSGCHGQIDPLGLSLEAFDGLGRHRLDDQGLPLDLSGDYDGVAFEGLAGLAETVAAAPGLHACFVRHSYRYAVGHAESAGESALLTALVEGGETAVLDVWAAVANSPGFRSPGGID
ncbi:MAG: DUF1592 domain-containing protein [Myxococcota bacterium]